MFPSVAHSSVMHCLCERKYLNRKPLVLDVAGVLARHLYSAETKKVFNSNHLLMLAGELPNILILINPEWITSSEYEDRLDNVEEDLEAWLASVAPSIPLSLDLDD
jgi:hypothetical protein